MFLAADRHGRRFVWEELYRHCLISELAADIKAKLTYRDEKGNVATLEPLFWLCDPLAFNEDPIDGKTWADEFWGLGLPVEKAPKRREAGILRVREILSDKSLFVCTNCERTIWEFGHYRWDDYHNAPDRNAKERPKDADDHMMENLYRGALMEHTWRPPEVSRPIREYQYV